MITYQYAITTGEPDMMSLRKAMDISNLNNKNAIRFYYNPKTKILEISYMKNIELVDKTKLQTVVNNVKYIDKGGIL